VTSMLKPLQGSGASFSLMICDFHTLKVISSCLRMHELNEFGVGGALNVIYERESMPGIPVVYFLTNSEDSIKAMLNDYKNPKKPKYGKVWFYITSSLIRLYSIS